MKHRFEKGDRVQSVVFGYYFGLPAVVVRLSQIQGAQLDNYVLELENTKKRFILSEKFIQPYGKLV